MIVLCFASLAIWLAGGCTPSAAHRVDRPDTALQMQRAVALDAARFTGIFRSLESGNVDEIDQTKKDMDLWVDQAIIELQHLEEQYPHGDWAAVELRQGSPVRMQSFYKRIADFRRDHPRRHSVQLDAQSLKRIDAFVQKYQ